MADKTNDDEGDTAERAGDMGWRHGFAGVHPLRHLVGSVRVTPRFAGVHSAGTARRPLLPKEDLAVLAFDLAFTLPPASHSAVLDNLDRVFHQFDVSGR